MNSLHRNYFAIEVAREKKLSNIEFKTLTSSKITQEIELDRWFTISVEPQVIC